ncbi:hypothetical protein JANAI62_31010 [Jannaschia pagri]|uniref:TupA-like ATPgrasp n=1 Tax=Jannaschia pagri TaxID=2829797 RepID=A0ABQ4NPZ3_9RHOB|nr:MULTISPECIES: ATP-grasp fold amidoligase family protein [unclassified Jannaschia]GIT92662.1 hypothetical protein JANAI61_31200 [Jannaschia sp. AI_61]GIT96478.1 hypothetical protein JANAI62_31010 [Jannaschia sp. AI_62]
MTATGTTRPKFGRNNQKSEFLAFVAREFYMGRGTEFRKNLSNKLVVKNLLEGSGIFIPEVYQEVEDLDAFDLDSLPEFFVLKYAFGWSGRGVMLLRKLTGDRFLDLMSLRIMSRAEIQAQQIKAVKGFRNAKRTPRWITEQFVQSTIPGRPVPMDYKFFCFQGRVEVILQIDRNTQPIRKALFNGEFVPLKPGIDYLDCDKGSRPGVPIVPLHAEDLLDTAKRLSRYTDAPFVSVDLYDSPEGVYFGEFTFSPGNVAGRSQEYSDAYHDRMEEAFLEAKTLLKSDPSTVGTFSPGPKHGPCCEPTLYGLLASGVLDSSVDSARALHRQAVQDGYDGTQRLNLAKSWRETENLLRKRLTGIQQYRERMIAKHEIEPARTP